MRNLNLDHLQALAEVVALGSFSAAAARLGLTQPAISLQIRQLERRMGVRLVERVGKRATATAAGRTLLEHGRRIEGAVAAAIEALAGHRAGTVGRVRLGTGATACIYLLPPVLHRLRVRFPELEIVVGTGNTPDILRAIEDNLMDVALVTLPARGRMIQATPLLDDEFVAIFAAGDPHIPPAATPAALARLPIVLFEPGARTRALVDAWFLRAGLTPKPVMELGSVEAIKELVGAGLGCSVLPRMAVEAAAGRLVVRPLAPRLHRRLGLVLRRDKPLDRGLREVVKALTELKKGPRGRPG
ncbi:MAG: LysR family transcriptional regulator [Alphaproteobacteria bacterium]|nr:LysR family transcriptional regulator [Alphaproteobacteria bacterium]